MERVFRDKVPYDAWERQGFITITNSEIVDQNVVMDYVLNFCKENELDIQTLCFDPANASKIMIDLSNEGYIVEEVYQSHKSLNEATEGFREEVYMGTVCYLYNPVLNYSMSNAVIKKNNGLIKIDKDAKVPVYLQIAEQIKAQIISGALPRASTLPSERALAQILDVHRNTVVKAYGELKSDAWIESRQGIGYVVAVPPAAEDGGEGEAGASDKPSRRVNWINEIKDRHLDMEKTFDDLFQRFTDESKYSLGSGISTNEVFRPERVAHDIAPLMTSAGCCQYFYSPYKGDKFLRQKLVSFLSTKGVKASTGEIQILSETNQAVDFIVTLLVQPGDTVVMEEPVHPDMSRAMELAGAKILTVPVDQDGMRVDLLEKLILHKHPRFIFVNSSFHDPTGHILSLERRKKIIEISNTYRVPIVEEDAASELVYEGEKLPPIKAFDTLENVIYIYSFSLTFVTGLSIAVVAANADVIRSLSYLVSVRLMASDWMTQKLLGRYLDDGTYYKALDEFRASYSRKQRLVCEKLNEMAALGVSY